MGSPFSNPPRTRAKVLDRLHEGHPGICKAKALARRYIWWPKIDADLERVVKSCGRCQEHGRMPLVAPLHPWEWPNRPRLRLHVDYASPFMRRMLLVILDVFSKWLEIHTVASATLQATTESTRASIATQSILDIIVSDNGSCFFISQEFELFYRSNGITHIKSASYHPASNGLAEQMVQTSKQSLKKMEVGTFQEKLQ